MSESWRKELNKLIKTKENADRKNNYKLVAEICENIGRLLYENNFRYEAIDQFKEMARIYRDLGRKLDYACALHLISDVYSETLDFESALKYANKYYEVARAEMSVLELQRATTTLGRIYYLIACAVDDNPSSVNFLSNTPTASNRIKCNSIDDNPIRDQTIDNNRISVHEDENNRIIDRAINNNTFHNKNNKQTIKINRISDNDSDNNESNNKVLNNNNINNKYNNEFNNNKINNLNNISNNEFNNNKINNLNNISNNEFNNNFNNDYDINISDGKGLDDNENDNPLDNRIIDNEIKKCKISDNMSNDKTINNNRSTNNKINNNRFNNLNNTNNNLDTDIEINGDFNNNRKVNYININNGNLNNNLDNNINNSQIINNNNNKNTINNTINNYNYNNKNIKTNDNTVTDKRININTNTDNRINTNTITDNTNINNMVNINTINNNRINDNNTSIKNNKNHNNKNTNTNTDNRINDNNNNNNTVNNNRNNTNNNNRLIDQQINHNNKNNNNTKEILNEQLKRANLLKSLDYHTKSQTYLKSLKGQVSKNELNEMRACQLLNLANIHELLANTDEAEQMYRDCAHLSQLCQSKDTEIKALLALSGINFEKRQYIESYSYAHECLRCLKKIRDQSLKFNVYFHLGKIQLFQAKFAESAHFFKFCNFNLFLADEDMIGDFRKFARACYEGYRAKLGLFPTASDETRALLAAKIAHVLFKIKSYDFSLKYFFNVLGIIKNKNIFSSSNNILSSNILSNNNNLLDNNISSNNILADNKNLSNNIFDNNSIFRDNDILSYNIYILYKYIGDCYYHLNNYSESIVYYHKCINNVDPADNAHIHLFLALSYFHQNSPVNEVIRLLKEALLIIPPKNFPLKLEILQNLKNVYDKYNMKTESNNNQNFINTLNLEFPAFSENTSQTSSTDSIDSDFDIKINEFFDDISDNFNIDSSEPFSNNPNNQLHNFSNTQNPTINSTKKSLRKKALADPNKKNERGESKLHLACIKGDLEKVKFFVENGAEINARDNVGWLPIHEAANHGHADIVKYLIDHGSYVNDKGGVHCEGITPLIDAAYSNRLEVIKVLLDNGADPSIEDDNHCTVLSILNSNEVDLEDSEIIQEILTKIHNCLQKKQHTTITRYNDPSAIDSSITEPVKRKLTKLDALSNQRIPLFVAEHMYDSQDVEFVSENYDKYLKSPSKSNIYKDHNKRNLNNDSNNSSDSTSNTPIKTTISKSKQKLSYKSNNSLYQSPSNITNNIDNKFKKSNIDSKSLKSKRPLSPTNSLNSSSFDSPIKESTRSNLEKHDSKTKFKPKSISSNFPPSPTNSPFKKSISNSTASKRTIDHSFNDNLVLINDNKNLLNKKNLSITPNSKRRRVVVFSSDEDNFNNEHNSVDECSNNDSIIEYRNNIEPVVDIPTTVTQKITPLFITLNIEDSQKKISCSLADISLGIDLIKLSFKGAFDTRSLFDHFLIDSDGVLIQAFTPIDDINTNSIIQCYNISGFSPFDAYNKILDKSRVQSVKAIEKYFGSNNLDVKFYNLSPYKLDISINYLFYVLLFKKITILDLSGFFIEDLDLLKFLGNSIPYFSSLEYLDISNMGLDFLKIKYLFDPLINFGGLESLKCINFSFNSLDGMPEELSNFFLSIFSKCKNISSIDIMYCGLVGFFDSYLPFTSFFQESSNISTLNFSGNHFEESQISNIFNNFLPWNVYESINISDISPDTDLFFPLVSFLKMSKVNIKNMNLSGNKLTQSISSLLTVSTFIENVVHLDLSNSQITSTTALLMKREIIRMKKLKYLHLYDNPDMFNSYDEIFEFIHCCCLCESLEILDISCTILLEDLTQSLTPSIFQNFDDGEAERSRTKLSKIFIRGNGFTTDTISDYLRNFQLTMYQSSVDGDFCVLEIR